MVSNYIRIILDDVSGFGFVVFICFFVKIVMLDNIR